MAAGRRLDVPVVDLASPDPRAAAKSTRQACVEYGFFYVINHGIERALLERVFADSRKSSSSRPWNGGEDGAGEEQQIQGLHLALLREGRRLPRVTRATGKIILSLIALSLDLDTEFFHKNGAFEAPSVFLRLLHYADMQRKR
ncbi:uncharacterized protein [Miscanthus floridulus]|uniref:uncharacterized protein isoform X1 n=1 Tax=Miscanthus floridulus TaxID=154761 RepID=UPI003458B84D